MPRQDIVIRSCRDRTLPILVNKCPISRSHAENGDGHAEPVDRHAEVALRHAENGDRRAENNDLHAD